MKVIHVLFVIGLFISPVIAEDYEGRKVSIDKGDNLNTLNSLPKTAREGYCKTQLYLSLVYDLNKINSENFLSCSIESE